MRSLAVAILLMSAGALRVERLDRSIKSTKWTATLGPFFTQDAATRSHHMHAFVFSQDAATHSDDMPSLKVEIHGHTYSFSVSSQSQHAIHLFDNNTEMTVVRSNGTVAGTIVDPFSTDVISFVGVDGGTLVFTSRSYSDYPTEDFLIEEGVEADALAEVESSGESVVHSGIPIMNALVVWTKAAECGSPGCATSWRSKNDISSIVDLAIEETNTGYINSAINARVHKVKGWRSSYVEEGINTYGRALAAIRKDSDNKLDWVHTKRNKFKAHLVAMIIRDSQYCGTATMGPKKENMFSVTSVECATGYYSFGHEIGHNLGCNHDRGTKGACKYEGVSNYGHREPSGEWRTVLAYNCKTGQCDENKKNSCPRVNYYSNPSVKYLGKPTGVKGESNNAAQISQSAATVAGYF